MPEPPRLLPHNNEPHSKDLTKTALPFPYYSYFPSLFSGVQSRFTAGFHSAD
jgi:hypothetical protein